MSGLTSQPSIGAVVGALENSPLDTGLKPALLRQINQCVDSLHIRPAWCPFVFEAVRVNTVQYV